MTISATIEVLIDEADQCLAQAEKESGKDLARSLQLLQQGVGKLLQAYLIANEKRSPTRLREQFELCQQIEPDFASIEEELEYLLSVNPKEAEAEDVIDTANEIWDFVTDLLENSEAFEEDFSDELD
ncbi:hypothetical protein EDC14_105220 [Hydrogenispora ethanolica]|uniref:Uncharacterized protein n=1 Tax=Hydrogenispora ethanolica TaxID=1082276 RepID=A0A4R1QQE4_HYDET|nr:hypothetical protein [Hydrogenispora ethanolica]TCL56039.1 hypothetical protein EDC14_105220 [Hydrogenispora ethanolica]